MGLFEKFVKTGADKKIKGKEPVIAAVIANTVDSEIYQDILKNNNIPFICRQRGAGGYIKILTGGLLIADSIYVKESDLKKAGELYKAYFGNRAETEIFDSEDI